jgi:hypothetical protein
MAETATIIPFRKLPPRDDRESRHAALIMRLMELADEADALGYAAIAQVLIGAASCLADAPRPASGRGGSDRA